MTMTRTEIDRIEFTEQETLASGGSVAISASVVGSRIAFDNLVKLETKRRRSRP